MPTIARYIGGAGTGKTTLLMDTLAKVLDRGVDPMRVGFVSFTRAARREASERAAARFGGSADQLEQDGWFRTLHSVCYRMVAPGSGALLSDDRESRSWIEKAIGESVATSQVIDEDIGEAFGHRSDASAVLALWGAARNRLEPFEPSYRAAEACGAEVPSLDRCLSLIERYELHKRLENRCDFTDLVARFAGYRIDPRTGAEQVTPQGEVPPLDVWFFDEQQDTSALLNAVCQRLIGPSTWVYVVGDPMQAIYGWSGADGSIFRRWDVAKEAVMPKSYRCPQPIHELGESILRGCSDYWDRGIAHADHSGAVEIERMTPGLLDEMSPDHPWLVLARTNYHAARLSKRIDEIGLPWAPTKGLGGWNRPAKNKAYAGLLATQEKLAITGDEWCEMVKVLPSKLDGEDLLKRGTKTKWQSPTPDERRRLFNVKEQIAHAGATDRLFELAYSGKWTEVVDGAEAYVSAVRRWGEDAVHSPRIRVGTVHSAKGAEADNVLWLTSSTRTIAKGRESQAGDNEERRVAYVAATRAKRRLIVAVEPNNRHRFEVAA